VYDPFTGHSESAPTPVCPALIKCNSLSHEYKTNESAHKQAYPNLYCLTFRVHLVT